MSVPLRVSDRLRRDARAASARWHRSLTQQVEHWAQLGRVVESALGVPSVGRLKALAAVPDWDRLLTAPETPAGRRKILAHLAQLDGPLFGPESEVKPRARRRRSTLRAAA